MTSGREAKNHHLDTWSASFCRPVSDHVQWDVFQPSLSLLSVKLRKTKDLVQKPVHRPALIRVLITILVYVLLKGALDCLTGKPKWPFHDEEEISLVKHKLLADSDLPNTWAHGHKQTLL